MIENSTKELLKIGLRNQVQILKSEKPPNVSRVEAILVGTVQ